MKLSTSFLRFTALVSAIDSHFASVFTLLALTFETLTASIFAIYLAFDVMASSLFLAWR